VPRLPTALLLASALVLAACAGSDDEAAVASDTSADTTTTALADPVPPTDAGSAPAVDVPEELDFVAPDVRGGQVVGSELAGQDLVIWFWAPW
jgi:ABC-type glycerol-3-phosphate transport system substrate-binding protein